jgi:hypothetical protein
LMTYTFYCTLSLLPIVVFFLCGGGTLGFELRAKQVLYLLSHTSTLFALVYF